MDTLYYRLENALKELLKDKQSQIEPSPPNTAPLFLLLTIKPDLVGFSILDGQKDEDFSKAFQIFKDFYSIHSSKWADFDLTIVLCKRDSKKISDEFCNKIEMDPYFCRKFVIDLSKDLKSELGRLPFIPLRPETIVGLKRPISAQTFLKKHGTNSDLARYLVVPHAKGIVRIVDECIEGVLGEPEWLGAEAEESLLPQYEVGPEVRLKELEVRNFRAYRDTYRFELDADLIVLFGPNGFGKTSFFDAIDFVSTGGVARFEERFARKTDRLLNALKHLDSSMEDSFVKATALMDSREVTIERYMKDRTNANLDGVPADRTKTLILLTGISEKPPDIRIDNLVRLFRATHLFGQEFQSLTSTLRDYSKLPEDTVSRMLALQDYVEGINKATEVYGEINKQIWRKESEINSLKESLRSKEAELEKLSVSAKIVEKPDAISALGREIRQKIIQAIGAPIEIPERLNKEAVRELRAKIEVQKNIIAQDMELIDKLDIKFPELDNHRTNVQDKSLKLAYKKELLNELSNDYTNMKKTLEASDAIIKRIFREETDLSSKRENLNWLLQAKGEYAQLKEQIIQENKYRQKIQANLLELSPKRERLKFEYKELEETVAKITIEIKILENKIKELNEFETILDNWQKALNRHKELQLNIQMLKQEIDRVRNELRGKEEEINAAIMDRDNLLKHIDNLHKNQSALRTVLDNIERHISNNICPVCGTQHRSRDELIEKLRCRRGIQPKEIGEAIKLLEDLNAIIDEQEKNVGAFRLKLKQSENDLGEAQKELINMQIEIQTYEKKAISLDIPIAHENLLSVIEDENKEIIEQVNTKQKELMETKYKTEKLQKEITDLFNQQEGLEQKLRTIISILNQLRPRIDQISIDASTRQLSLEREEEMIQQDLTAATRILEDSKRQIEIKQAENKYLQKETGNLLEKKYNLEREIQELEKEIFNSKKNIEEVENIVNRLKLNLSIDTKQVLALRKESTRKLSSLDTLQNEIINYEIALDAMETSALLAKIQVDIKNINNNLLCLGKEREQLNNWASYFDIICKELGLLQNRALKEYTEKYGPLTSTIQRRLRSVYGFGDIRIYPERGGIAVRVERKKEKNIYPSDFFSESQIQIVMLSLFLSATLTQTWSSFSPILLDDPVEHFDDLNAFSLLDLIRGLILEPANRHQFIISTCEDRLFRLMRQKFSKMNSKVIFYSFESIGENGPKIRRL